MVVWIFLILAGVGCSTTPSPRIDTRTSLDSFLGILGLRRLRLQAQQVEEPRHAVEGAGRQLVDVNSIEVVDESEAAGHGPQQYPLQCLQCVGRAVEIPHRRRSAETHHHVEPHGDPLRRCQESSGVRQVLYRALPVRVEEVAAEDAVPAGLPLCRSATPRRSASASVRRP